MSEGSQLESGSSSDPHENRAQWKRKRSPDDEGDLTETEEVEQTSEEQTDSDSGSDVEQWHPLYRRGDRKRQKWYRDRSRAALDKSIDLLSTAVSLCSSSESDRDDIMFALADVLDERYRIQGSDDDLQQCIALLRETLKLRLPGHLERSASLNSLAAALRCRYARFGDVDDLEEFIRLYQQALALRPEGHPHRSCTLNNLINAFRVRYERFRDITDLDESIRLHQQALELCPEGHPDRSCYFNNLAIVLGMRYAHSGDVADLEEKIRLHQEALALCPEGDPHRSMCLDNLGNALGARYERFRGVADLEEKIRLLQQALAMRPEGHPNRSCSLNNLAAALAARYTRFRDVADLEEKIRLFQQAIAVCPEGHSHRSSYLNNLALSLDDRYACFGNVADLEECIHLHQEALALLPESHPHRSNSLNSLATALGGRYSRFGNVADLDERIHLHQQALALCPENHPNRSGSLEHLATALSVRYERFGDIADLEEDVRLHQQVLALRPEGHPNRPDSLNNLAAALGMRYKYFGDIADLEEEIRLHQQALALRPEGHQHRSCSLNNLAAALGERYARFNDVTDLEEKIHLHQQALALHPEGHPDRSMSLAHLAHALSIRYARSGDVADMDETIHLLQQALALRPEGSPDRSCRLSNLANALSARYACSGDVADLEEAVRLSQQAVILHPEGHPHRSGCLHNLACALNTRYAHFGDVSDLDAALLYLRTGSLDVSSPRTAALKCSFRWIEIAEKHEHDSLDDAFKHGVANLRQFLSIGPTTQLQYKALLRETRITSLPIAAAAHFIGKGRIEEAIELLDEGRALLTSEMRRFREALTAEERAMLGEELSTRYLDICKDLRNLSNAEVRFETFSDSSAAASKLAHENGSQSSVAYGELLKQKRLKMEAYTNVLQQIRQIPGCEDFQQTSKFVKLKQAAEGGPVVIINCSERRSDIIIIFSHRTPLLISLDGWFYPSMHDTYDWFLAQMVALKEKRDVASTISDFLAPIAKQLWNKLVRQVVGALRDNGIPEGARIWWCPTSFLTSLPLHAAGNGSEWLLDHYVSSYTPTLHALISTRQITVPEPSLPRILVVVQTVSSGLKNAGSELKQMQMLPSFRESLDEDYATPQTVAEHLPSYNWAHFICHGTVTDNPFESYLHLHDGSRLTLNDIIKLHMVDAKFAFLAACHSAAQSRDANALRDEVLSLASAMQISGFRSVVGTMWQMEDEDGPRMARKFYEAMFKDECRGEKRHTLAATALWKAVRWLKDKSMKEEREGKGKRGNKKKEEMPISRWANYVHIGA